MIYDFNFNFLSQTQRKTVIKAWQNGNKEMNSVCLPTQNYDWFSMAQIDYKYSFHFFLAFAWVSKCVNPFLVIVGTKVIPTTEKRMPFLFGWPTYGIWTRQIMFTSKRVSTVHRPILQQWHTHPWHPWWWLKQKNNFLRSIIIDAITEWSSPKTHNGDGGDGRAKDACFCQQWAITGAF